MKRNKSKLTNNLLRIWPYVQSGGRFELLMVFGLSLATAMFEMLGVGAVVPFISVLTNPVLAMESHYFQPVMLFFDIKTKEDLLMVVTIFFIASVLLAGIFRLSQLLLQTRLAYRIGAEMSMDIYSRTLHQKYIVHLSRNSSEIISGVSTKVFLIVNDVILPVLNIASGMVIILIILGMLIWVEPTVAISVFFGLGFLYILVALSSKRLLSRESTRLSLEHVKVIKALQEGLGGIRDILLDGVQDVYCSVYKQSDMRLRRAQANIQVISISPRFLIEGLGISFMAFVAYRLSAGAGDLIVGLPMMGALILGAQRLLPLFQQIYHGWSSLNASNDTLEAVLALLNQPLPDVDLGEVEVSPIKFECSIAFNEVEYTYNLSLPKVLKSISFEINKGDRVGIIGITGSGKSTLLDILMGLLEPTKGGICVDGKMLHSKNIKSWQKSIAHVPQTIYLSDASIEENIAFGVPLNEIDRSRVILASKKAQLHSYISSLEDGYQTSVGERGVRLSGGQRQRIGIARALYKNSNIIIFDEATSALDSVTELAVMDVFNNLSNEITVIMVAHRLSTLSGCNRIVRLSEGEAEVYSSIESVR